MKRFHRAQRSCGGVTSPPNLPTKQLWRLRWLHLCFTLKPSGRAPRSDKCRLQAKRLAESLHPLAVRTPAFSPAENLEAAQLAQARSPRAVVGRPFYST